jgi:mono/diheme cytochrome c family protein
MPKQSFEVRSSRQRHGAAGPGKVLLALTMVAAFAGALNSWAAQPQTASSEDQERPSDGFLVAKGRGTYRVYCANCHGPKGLGDGTLADLLKIRPADLTVLTLNASDGRFPRKWVHAKIDGREAVAGHGSADMPVWGDAFQRVQQPGYQDLSDEERAQLKIVELVYYLESIQKPIAP